MSLFVCEECGTVENTALSLYWMRGDGRALCSRCDPQLGHWHGIFPRESYDPERHQVLNPPGTE